MYANYNFNLPLRQMYNIIAHNPIKTFSILFEWNALFSFQ